MDVTPDAPRDAALPPQDGPHEGRSPVAAADEDALLGRYGAALADAVEAALGSWLTAAVESRLGRAAPGTDREGTVDAAGPPCADAHGAVPGSPGGGVEALVAEAVPMAVADIGGRLRELLALDVDQQWTNPLSIIRQAVAYPTAILNRAGVPPIERDATDTRLHPDDHYGLVPATFADLGPEVHQRGLEWGAAKAHVHLRRRQRAVSP